MTKRVRFIPNFTGFKSKKKTRKKTLKRSKANRTTRKMKRKTVPILGFDNIRVD